MVAEVTHHPADFIEWEMPLARGLQFQALYLDRRAREDERAGFKGTYTRALTTGPNKLAALAG